MTRATTTCCTARSRRRRIAPFRVVSGLTRVAQGGLALAGTVGLLLSLEWMLALVLLASALPGVAVKIRASRALYAWRRARTEEERRAWYYQSVLIDGAYAKEARLFGFGETVRGWFREVRARLRGGHEQLLRRRAAGDLAAQALGVVPVFVALGYLAASTMAGRHTLGDLVLYYTAVQRGSAFLQELLSGLASLYEDNLFLSSFEEFLALPVRVRDPERAEAVPRPHPGGIRRRVAPLPLRAKRGASARRREPRHPPRRGGGAPGRERGREDDAREAAVPPVRPRGGAHPPGRSADRSVRGEKAAPAGDGGVPGPRTLQPDRAGERGPRRRGGAGGRGPPRAGGASRGRDTDHRSASGRLRGRSWGTGSRVATS